MDFQFNLPTEQDEVFWFADDLGSDTFKDDEDELQEPSKGVWQLEVEFMMRLA